MKSNGNEHLCCKDAVFRPAHGRTATALTRHLESRRTHAQSYKPCGGNTASLSPSRLRLQADSNATRRRPSSVKPLPTWYQHQVVTICPSGQRSTHSLEVTQLLTADCTPTPSPLPPPLSSSPLLRTRSSFHPRAHPTPTDGIFTPQWYNMVDHVNDTMTLPAAFVKALAASAFYGPFANGMFLAGARMLRYGPKVLFFFLYFWAQSSVFFLCFDAAYSRGIYVYRREGRAVWVLPSTSVECRWMYDDDDYVFTIAHFPDISSPLLPKKQVKIK